MFPLVLLSLFTSRPKRPANNFDREAFTRLYQEQAEPIYRYFRTRTSQPTEAEDLTSLVFRKALESWPTYRADQSAAAWLFGIAHHVLADYFRQYARLGRQATALDDQPDQPDAAPGPEESALQAEEARLLRQALRDLPPLQAEAVSLRFIAGLSYPEIAQALGKKEPAVRMLLHRGLENLRKSLTERPEWSGILP